MAKYFMVECSEDGDVYVHVYSKLELEQLLVDEEYKIADGIPDMNVQYWNGRVLIIKGEIVVPKPVAVVTQFEVP